MHHDFRYVSAKHSYEIWPNMLVSVETYQLCMGTFLYVYNYSHFFRSVSAKHNYEIWPNVFASVKTCRLFTDTFLRVCT